MFFPAARVLFLVGALFSPLAMAAPVATLSSEQGSFFAERASFDYELAVKGGSFDHLDGNSDGKGANFQIRHYQDFKFLLIPGLRLEAGTQFRQVFKPANPKKSDQRAVEFRDPYLGIGIPDFWKQKSRSFSAEIHYYLPFSEHNESRWGKLDDEGRGLLHFETWYSQKLGQDRWRMKLPVELNYRRAKVALEDRYDYWIGFKPSLSYKTGRRTTAKVEYFTGELNHRTNGSFTRLNDPKLGQTLAFQLEWKPIENAELTPEIKWGREKFRFGAAELSLSAVYSFL